MFECWVCNLLLLDGNLVYGKFDWRSSFVGVRCSADSFGDPVYIHRVYRQSSG